MSAWKPSVCGRSTISSSSTMRRQLCMPPQQISPSAASRSPWSSAILQASRKVSAIRFWLPAGSSSHAVHAAGRVDPHDAVGPDAQLAQLLGDAAALARPGVEELAGGRPASPMAEPPPVGGHTGATTVPISKLARAGLVGQLLQFVVVGVDADVRVEEEQVEAVEPHAVDLGVGGQDRASCPDRWAARRRAPLPTTPGQAAL